MNRINQSLCTIGLAGMLSLMGCSKPAPPPVQAPATTNAMVEQPPAAIDIPDVILPTEPEAKNLSLFNDYVGLLRAGDLMQASAALSTLKSRLKGEDLGDPFWQENLPSSHRVMLLIGALCTACTDGACQACKGHHVCQTCQGSGLCTLCKGRGGEWLMCQKCICPACRGSRACSTCQGRQTLACPACKGSGIGSEEKKFEPCPSCGGRGYKDGFKGPNGTMSRFKCLKCNGAMGTYATLHVPCAACHGTGRKNCDACRGTGACTACRGLGRLPTCAVCAGQGRYLNPCSACKGAKVCQTCSGSKLCQTCQGQGTCRECLGHNLVVRYRFPIDRRWLAQPEARVFQPGPDGLLTSLLSGTTATLSINGRAVSADVPANSLLWASAPEDLRRIQLLFTTDP